MIYIDDGVLEIVGNLPTILNDATDMLREIYNQLTNNYTIESANKIFTLIGKLSVAESDEEATKIVEEFKKEILEELDE